MTTQEKQIKTARDKLKPGAWYNALLKYAGGEISRGNFCVLKIQDRIVFIEGFKGVSLKQQWHLTEDFFQCDPVFLGYGRKRTFIGRWLFGTTYTNP